MPGPNPKPKVLNFRPRKPQPNADPWSELLELEAVDGRVVMQVGFALVQPAEARFQGLES